MLLNVDDARLNLILNSCFWGLALLTLLSVMPWGLTGRAARAAFWLPAAAMLIYGVYEWAMPSRMDIRVDLLLIAPMGFVIVAAWGVRMIFGRRREA